MLARARGRLTLAPALIAMVGLALLPSPAAANDQQFPVGGDAMNQAMATAQQHWGGVPCGGAVELRWSDLDQSMNAQATWTATPGAPPSTYTGCLVEFNRQIPYDYGRLCSAMLHEVGHLMGQAHSTDPGSPMSHEYLGPVGPCSLGDIPEQDDSAWAEEEEADFAPRSASTTTRRRTAKRCKTRYAKRKSGRKVKRRVCTRKRTNRH